MVGFLRGVQFNPSTLKASFNTGTSKAQVVLRPPKITFSGIVHCSGQSAFPSDPNQTYEDDDFSEPGLVGVSPEIYQYSLAGVGSGEWNCAVDWCPGYGWIGVGLYVYGDNDCAFETPDDKTHPEAPSIIFTSVNPISNRFVIGSCGQTHPDVICSGNVIGYGGQGIW